jgi:hypothetical protein
MECCFDKENYDSIYSKFTLTPEIRGYQKNAVRPEEFKQGSKVNGFYKGKLLFALNNNMNYCFNMFCLNFNLPLIIIYIFFFNNFTNLQV